MAICLVSMGQFLILLALTLPFHLISAQPPPSTSITYKTYHRILSPSSPSFITSPPVWQPRGFLHLQNENGALNVVVEDAEGLIRDDELEELEGKDWYQLAVGGEEGSRVEMDPWAMSSVQLRHLSLDLPLALTLILPPAPALSPMQITLSPSRNASSSAAVRLDLERLDWEELKKAVALGIKIDEGQVLASIGPSMSSPPPANAPPNSNAPPGPQSIDPKTGLPRPAKPADERSFIAKYWIYILGGTLMIGSIMGGEPEKKGGAAGGAK